MNIETGNLKYTIASVIIGLLIAWGLLKFFDWNKTAKKEEEVKNELN